MLRIESYERAIENQSKDLRADGINPTLFWAYRESCKAENELVNFSEVIWDNEIEAIAEECKNLGIEEFTISSTFSSLIDTLAKFEKLGFRMNGLCIVNLPYNSIVDGKRATANAIKMKRA